MIYAFIRGYIGGIGRAILDFYIANSLVINAIVLAYGLMVYLAHISYLSAYRLVLEKLGVNIEKAMKTKGRKKYSSADLNYRNLAWDEVRKAYWFPFIAPPKNWAIRLKTERVLRNHFSADNLAQLLNNKTDQ
jgi:hypothetical protein